MQKRSSPLSVCILLYHSHKMVANTKMKGRIFYTFNISVYSFSSSASVYVAHMLPKVYYLKFEMVVGGSRGKNRTKARGNNCCLQILRFVIAGKDWKI